MVFAEYQNVSFLQSIFGFFALSAPLPGAADSACPRASDAERINSKARKILKFFMSQGFKGGECCFFILQKTK
ncbi:MAG: hypothetical protein WDN09_03480 [bacterium]